MDAQTEKPVREHIIRRFEQWLDAVLAEEAPVKGIARELLYEIEDASVSPSVNRKDDLYSTWSAITALTQEIKLQGRAFSQLNDRLESLPEPERAAAEVLEACTEAIAEARRIAEQAGQVHIDRENEFRRAVRDSTHRELLKILVDIRNRLAIGLRTAEESRCRIEDNRPPGLLRKLRFGKRAEIAHALEITGSLKKGYLLSLERIDEAMQQLELYEIVCEGEPFDPQKMSAVDIEETEDLPDGTVLEVYRPGYMIGDKIFQPAQVKVARSLRKNI